MLSQVFVDPLSLRVTDPGKRHQSDYGRVRDGLQVTRLPCLDQPGGLRFHLLGIGPKGDGCLIAFVNNSCSLVMNMINILKLSVVPKRRWGNGFL